MGEIISWLIEHATWTIAIPALLVGFWLGRLSRMLEE